MRLCVVLIMAGVLLIGMAAINSGLDNTADLCKEIDRQCSEWSSLLDQWIELKKAGRLEEAKEVKRRADEIEKSILLNQKKLNHMTMVDHNL